MHSNDTPAEQRPETTNGAAGTPPFAEVREQELEGGYVSEFPEVAFDERRHRAKTASRLAFTFAWIFAGALFVHYVTFFALALLGRNEAMAALSDVFNVWLPALIGIVSAAATYYFTKER